MAAETMTDAKILLVLDLYEVKLANHPESLGALAHVQARMIPEMRKMIARLDDVKAGHAYMSDQGIRDERAAGREKIMRWLGFIQGVLFVRGIYTIDEMRAHNMPDDEAFRAR